MRSNCKPGLKLKKKRKMKWNDWPRFVLFCLEKYERDWLSITNGILKVELIFSQACFRRGYLKQLYSVKVLGHRFSGFRWLNLLVFSFLPKNVHFISKNAVLSLFLKNVSPSKTVVCFILNNLHFPMVEGIVFYGVFFSTKKCAFYFKKCSFVFVS